jgi:hypothetical protein
MRTFSRGKRDILQEKRDIFLVTRALQAHSKKTAKIVAPSLLLCILTVINYNISRELLQERDNHLIVLISRQPDQCFIPMPFAILHNPILPKQEISMFSH